MAKTLVAAIITAVLVLWAFCHADEAMRDSYDKEGDKWNQWQ